MQEEHHDADALPPSENSPRETDAALRKRSAEIRTRLTRLGRSDKGFVNPSVVRGSTVTFQSLDEFEEALACDLKDGPFTYGLLDTPTTRALAQAIAELDGADGAVLLESGLAAVGVAMLSQVKQGDHILMVDSCYGPSRILCEGMLKRMGVETEYYDPRVGQDGRPGIETLFRENTRLVFMESPGSVTFEMQDVPAIAAACRERDIITAIDNTWATPLGFRPIEHGVDMVVHALTKYVGGHSDVMLGAVTTRTRKLWDRVKITAMDLGHGVSPDDAWLGLRGLRTLAVRLDAQEHAAVQLARWLQTRSEVKRVLHPALPEDPGHAIFKRDFDRATGLFGVVLHPVDRASLARMLEGMAIFEMGYSWGGFESLLIPQHPLSERSVTPWTEDGTLLRVSVGLESVEHLTQDLADGLDRLTR
ncbi:MAG: cystathionine beta-lyase [Phycisphaera sp. TMED9]|nr:MAG: cystathionine beta-lyase [Phycisphaera sp. TMED9]